MAPVLVCGNLYVVLPTLTSVLGKGSQQYEVLGHSLPSYILLLEV